jgi:hypothetical protein
MTFNAESDSFSSYKHIFQSLKDIEDIQNQEYQRYLNGKEEVKRSRIEYNENFNKNIQ